MRLTFRLLAALFIGPISAAWAFAQPATPTDKAEGQPQKAREQSQKSAEQAQQAELKKAQEQLERLLQQLRDQETKKPRAETPKPAATPGGDDAARLHKLLNELREQENKKARPEAAKPFAPPTPPLPPAPSKPMVWTTPAQGGGDSSSAMAAVKGLLSSKDPKTVALARELLEHLARSTAKPEGGAQFEFHLAPSPGGKAIELKLESLSKVKPGAGADYRVTPPAVERRVVVAAERTGPAGGSSTLKLSADGKVAAIVDADGTVTVFDVVSGKEMMKFAGKK
jgi:hypothetical protein